MPTASEARKDLALVLSYLTGRKLTLDEVLAAVEMSRSTFYYRQSKGTLTKTDTVLTAARNLGLNPVGVLVRFGHIADSEVADYIEDCGADTGPTGSVRVADLTTRTDVPPL
ncbi:helix-turn-helix transcriptional regulator [Mycolicibacterium baixiangningiae]|uniref:helix-turn-helix transcriptional regulator n=1 Tax=Mycolicibacterium baixiangningiae TaxID=2761578 RepID=UPI001E352F12|nr:hypothetical protein [Mycolicibacterium baixiangningiae]